MADKKISDLTSATTLTGAELLETEQGGNSRQTTTQAVANLGGLVKIGSTQSPSGVAALDFTSGITSAYNVYIIELQNILPSVDAVTFRSRTTTNAGSSFDSGASDYLQSDIFAAQMELASSVGNAAGESGFSGTIKIVRPSSTTLNCSILVDGMYVGSGGAMNRVNTAFARATAADVDGIRFYFGSGNIASGKATLYGVTP